MKKTQKIDAGPAAVVHCPVCNKAVQWDDTSRWKPFCSKRCSLIDLGEWLEEKPRIPGPADFSDADDW